MMDNTEASRSELTAMVDSALVSRASRDRHLVRLIGVMNLPLDLTRRHNSDARSHLFDT
jgi:hypothetical protein